MLFFLSLWTADVQTSDKTLDSSSSSLNRQEKEDIEYCRILLGQEDLSFFSM